MRIDSSEGKMHFQQLLNVGHGIRFSRLRPCVTSTDNLTVFPTPWIVEQTLLECSILGRASSDLQVLTMTKAKLICIFSNYELLGLGLFGADWQGPLDSVYLLKRITKLLWIIANDCYIISIQHNPHTLCIGVDLAICEMAIN